MCCGVKYSNSHTLNSARQNKFLIFKAAAAIMHALHFIL